MAYDIITGIQHNDQRVDHEYWAYFLETFMF